MNGNNLAKVSEHSNLKLSGKWFPSILVALFYLIRWAPPFIPTLNNNWYIALGLGIVAFLLQKATITMEGSKLFWSFYGISLFGAIISLFRAPDQNQALYNTVAMGVNLIILFIYLPIISTKLTRKILLWILIISSILWTFKIQGLVNEYGTLIFSTFAKTGENKNDIGYTLALAATTLFYLAAFYRSEKSIQSLSETLLRFTFLLLGGYLFYYQALIYAKGSLLATGAGFIIVLILMVIKSKQKLKLALLIAALLFIIVIISPFVVTRIQQISPRWVDISESVVNEGITSISNNRELLLKKGIYLISQNPFIGVGIGGSRYPISTYNNYFPGYLIHNTFLTNWAEKGILGLISDIIWLVALFKVVKQKLTHLDNIDQIWIILIIPLIVQMMLKNIAYEIMVVILAGIYYEQYIIGDSSRASTPGMLKGRP
ncbi:MAG: O-antigen ligase family protein [Candidatus Helarchaeota archaeon]